MGYGVEVGMIRRGGASSTCSPRRIVFSDEDALAMTDTGADIVVCHMGLTTGGVDRRRDGARASDDCVARIGRGRRRPRSVRDDVIVLCHGGPISLPDDASYVLLARRRHPRLLPAPLEHGASPHRDCHAGPDRGLQGRHLLICQVAPLSAHPPRSPSEVRRCVSCVSTTSSGSCSIGVRSAGSCGPPMCAEASRLCVLDVKLAPGKGHDFHTPPAPGGDHPRAERDGRTVGRPRAQAADRRRRGVHPHGNGARHLRPGAARPNRCACSSCSDRASGRRVTRRSTCRARNRGRRCDHAEAGRSR